MRKQIALVIDASGSMFHPAGNDCEHDKILEAAESVQWILDNIKNLVDSSNDEWAVTPYYFANQTNQLTGQTLFAGVVPDMLVDIMKDVVGNVVNQAVTQGQIGNLTDIFGAVHEVAEFLVNNPPTWNAFPVNGPPDVRSIVLFTDGNQTIAHGGGLTRADYEAANGVDFDNLLSGQGIVLSAQGIGSDLLAATLETLVDAAAPDSFVKVIADDVPGYSADCSAAIMSNAAHAVNNNGILSLRPAGKAPSGLLWEQFSLPRLQTAPEVNAGHALAGITHLDTQVALAASVVQRVNHADFEVDVDGMTKQLLLGLTWHQRGLPSIEAVAPSGQVVTAGINGAYQITDGWMTSLHIPEPELGLWRVRVTGDRRHRPLRLNLMARGINRNVKFRARTNPYFLDAPGETVLTAVLKVDGAIASGNFKVQATPFFETASTELAQQPDGSFAGPIAIETVGRTPILIELFGELETGASLHRLEFASAQVGRPRDARIAVAPSVFERGDSVAVDVTLVDGSFGRSSQIDFGDGIVVNDFTVLSSQQARAQITVDPAAIAGPREVVTRFPAAETMTGIEIARGEVRPLGPAAKICCLRFDASGALTAVVLCDGRSVRVCKHSTRLQHLLELARERGSAVHLRIDKRGCLVGVDICRQ